MIKNNWYKILYEEFKKPYFLNLMTFLNEEYRKYHIYPPKDKVFQALELTDYEDVKVVIIGQDPYHGPNQAHGLCFSVNEGVAIPPSLKNIFTELKNDMHIEIPKSGNLTKWAKQGVLLLNAIMTVREGCPHSHLGKGWEIFTDKIIEVLNERNKPVIFFLWGNDAKRKARLITNPNHYILTAAHPSPLSAFQGFFGCHHFSKANAILRMHKIEEIDWKI